MDLSIIIVNYNTKKLLIDCIESIVKYTKGLTYEIIVVDNDSTEQVHSSWFSVHKEELNLNIILNKENKGFGAANNIGMKIAKGKYILLLNSDTIVLENSFQKLIQWMDAHANAGVVSCTLLNPDYSLQANGGNFPALSRIFLWATFLDDIPGIALLLGSFHLSAHTPITKEVYKKANEFDWVSGSVFLLRKEVFEKVGGFDENIFMYTEEVEYCYRIKEQGWKIWFVPVTKVIHIGSASSRGQGVKFAGVSFGKEASILGEWRGIQYFYKKHYSLFSQIFLTYLLKLAALLRIIIFGILGRQEEAKKIYAKAFEIA